MFIRDKKNIIINVDLGQNCQHTLKEYNIFNKWYMENGMFTCIRMKLDAYL